MFPSFYVGADATLLPLAAALNGIGFVTISRLAPDLPESQKDLARIQSAPEGLPRWP